MKAAITFLVLTLVMAGCSGPGQPAEAAAKQAATASIAAVADQYDYLLFLGITGTEGPLNWTLYEEALRGASDPGASIADGFDQDRDHGLQGDGRLASWLTTHFVFDEDRQLLGGLYTQYSDEGVQSIYAPFRGPYSGTPGLPGLQTHPALEFLAQRQAQQDTTVLCGIVSSTDAWHIDSAAAASIATARPLMQAHTEAYPEGEFTYYYFPGLDVEPGCPAEMTAQSNYWIISHVDMDHYLDGGMPTMAEVRIDAATGEVLEEIVKPLYHRAPQVIDLTIVGQDPAVPRTAPVTRNASFIVEPLVTTLDITINRSQAPAFERSAATRLVDPSGRVWDGHAFDDTQHGYRVTKPAPGRWTVEYIHQALEPNGAHRLEVHARGSYA